MSTTLKHEYPVQLLGYPARLAKDQQCAAFILMDEYVFATYFTTLLQGIRQDSSDDVVLGRILSQVIPDFDLQDFEPLADRMGLDKQEKLMQIVNNLRAQFSENITTTYVRDFILSTAIYNEINSEYRSSADAVNALSRIVTMMTDQMVAELAGKVTSITHNLRRIMDVIDLTEAEARLIEMNLLFSIDVRSAIFRDFLFTVTKNPQMFEYFYKTMLGDDMADGNGVNQVDEAFAENSKPIALGIVNYDGKTKRMSNMSEFWVYAISGYAASEEKFFDRFVEPLSEKKKTFSGAIAKASPIDEDLMKEFLGKAYDLVDAQPSNKPADDEAIGLNLLVYGAGRLDKLGYVTNFLDKLEIKGMKVRTRDAKSADIPSITYIAQQRVKQMTSNSDPIILVVEKAEQALTKNRYRPSWMMDMFESELDGKKEELDSDEMLLIKNPVPSIWLVDSASRITADNIGRFLFHVELKGGSRADRRSEVTKVVVDELNFSPDIAAKLAKYYELNVEQIKSAARTIQILEHDGEKGEKSLIHMIANSQRALDREKMEELRDSVTKYSLEYLNLGGNVPIDKVVAALKRKQSGNMCLYGPPGTGKTQLAEFIATELDKPLLIKPASALLDKYLGETEKKIAEMFDEAKAEGAILLLDEADSFLRDRAMATKSWEVTQVNELLQRMERFQGVFICATNLFQSLDAAALRRFTFKLEFKPLTFEQRWKMLINESGVDLNALPDDERHNVEIELGNIKHLTPGDFATVRRQANLLDEIDLDVYTWIDRLNIESKAKMLGLERNGMGFIPAGGETSPKDR